MERMSSWSESPVRKRGEKERMERERYGIMRKRRWMRRQRRRRKRS